jgi:hypothetical protein
MYVLRGDNMNKLFLGLLVLIAACAPVEPDFNQTNDDWQTEEIIHNQTGQIDRDEQIRDEIGTNQTIQPGDTDNLGDLMQRISQSGEYKVTHLLTSSENPEPFGEQTLVRKGQDMKLEFRTDEGTISTYYLGQEAYICAEFDQETECFQTVVTDADITIADWEDDVSENWQDYDITLSGQRTIAGARASCFIHEVEDAVTEYCYSDEGVPLFIRIVSGGIITEMTAIEYSTEVSEEEMTLPAEPRIIEVNQ